MVIKEVANFIIKNKLNTVLVLLWLFIAVVAMVYHEAGYWDELRPALAIKELNLNDLYLLVKRDGHPYLWYLILYPLIKLNFGDIGMKVISLLFVFASILLLFFKSNFNMLLKIFIAYSSGMIYFMGIVPRNYCLVPFFLFSIAIFYEKRNNHPYIYSALLILLSQTHVYMWGVCIILSLIFLYEKIRALHIFQVLLIFQVFDNDFVL